MLRRLVEPIADNVRVCRAEANAAAIRRYTETRYGAKSWHVDRRVVARIEATTQGLDIRYVVTSFTHGSAEWLYDSLYCARGQAENLIKLHKSQLASDYIVHFQALGRRRGNRGIDVADPQVFGSRRTRWSIESMQWKSRSRI